VVQGVATRRAGTCCGAACAILSTFATRICATVLAFAVDFFWPDVFGLDGSVSMASRNVADLEPLASVTRTSTGAHSSSSS
jgi:hypothetical protein